MGEWVEIYIDDLFSVQNGYAFKSGDFVDEHDDCLEVLKMGHIEKGGGLRKNPKKSYIPRSVKLERWILDKDDIVIAMTDMKDNVVILGVPAKIDRNNHYVLNQRVARLKLKRHDIADVDFLYSYLKWKDFILELQSKANSGVQVNLSTTAIKESAIMLPSLTEQKSIASVLSSLDDKINLLHRQNKTLEAMAETLFRQWFVEEAQEDWGSHGLLDVVQLVGGGTPKTSITEYWDGEIPWLAGGDIAANHKSFINDSEKEITETGLNNSSAKLLPKYATVISARGTVGKYCLISRPMAFSQSNYGILPKVGECFFFSYLLINHVVEELQSSAYGSVFDTITTNTFKGITMQLPDGSVIDEFENSVAPYFNKMLQNKEQIQTLKKLRDALLPKLMSGEVIVS